MDFDLNFVKLEDGEESLDENEEAVNQPNSGENTNKCSQCDFACSDPSNLRAHLKTASHLHVQNKLLVGGKINLQSVEDA